MSNNTTEIPGQILPLDNDIINNLFWANKIYEEIDTIIHIGCDDGSTLSAYRRLFPANDIRFIYINDDIAMLEKAKKSSKSPKDIFCRTLQECPTDCENALVLLSNELHKVSSSVARETLLQAILEKAPKYIAICDSAVSEDSCCMYSPLDKETVRSVRKEIKRVLPVQLKEFENVWGSISTAKELFHFLVKYRDKSNWSAQLKDNIFSISQESFRDMFAHLNYDVEYRHTYLHPAIRFYAKHDFNVDVKSVRHNHTHMEMIVRRRNITKEAVQSA